MGGDVRAHARVHVRSMTRTIGYRLDIDASRRQLAPVCIVATKNCAISGPLLNEEHHHT